ncbi:MAG: hypothetical protein KIT72_13340 [Polyangiaceae bacterium]|nr:hypothetical protein [Polyangiaceae bacterium]MCW5791396.1 hypothetical protein [Polyangiaceae bacterium]
MKHLTLCWLGSLALLACETREIHRPDDPAAAARCSARCDELSRAEQPVCAKPDFPKAECERALEITTNECRLRCQERHAPGTLPREP